MIFRDRRAAEQNRTEQASNWRIFDITPSLFCTSRIAYLNHINHYVVLFLDISVQRGLFSRFYCNNSENFSSTEQFFLLLFLRAYRKKRQMNMIHKRDVWSKYGVKVKPSRPGLSQCVHDAGHVVTGET